MAGEFDTNINSNYANPSISWNSSQEPLTEHNPSMGDRINTFMPNWLQIPDIDPQNAKTMSNVLMNLGQGLSKGDTMGGISNAFNAFQQGQADASQKKALIEDKQAFASMLSRAANPNNSDKMTFDGTKMTFQSQLPTSSFGPRAEATPAQQVAAAFSGGTPSSSITPTQAGAMVPQAGSGQYWDGTKIVYGSDITAQAQTANAGNSFVDPTYGQLSSPNISAQDLANMSADQVSGVLDRQTQYLNMYAKMTERPEIARQLSYLTAMPDGPVKEALIAKALGLTQVPEDVRNYAMLQDEWGKLTEGTSLAKTPPSLVQMKLDSKLVPEMLDYARMEKLATKDPATGKLMIDFGDGAKELPPFQKYREIASSDAKWKAYFGAEKDTKTDRMKNAAEYNAQTYLSEKGKQLGVTEFKADVSNFDDQGIENGYQAYVFQMAQDLKAKNPKITQFVPGNKDSAQEGTILNRYAYAKKLKEDAAALETNKRATERANEMKSEAGKLAMLNRNTLASTKMDAKETKAYETFAKNTDVTNRKTVGYALQEAQNEYNQTLTELATSDKSVTEKAALEKEKIAALIDAKKAYNDEVDKLNEAVSKEVELKIHSVYGAKAKIITKDNPNNEDGLNPGYYITWIPSSAENAPYLDDKNLSFGESHHLKDGSLVRFVAPLPKTMDKVK